MSLVLPYNKLRCAVQVSYVGVQCVAESDTVCVGAGWNSVVARLRSANHNFNIGRPPQLVNRWTQFFRWQLQSTVNLFLFIYFMICMHIVS
uniref:Uncharacterized protein n=1 Tax=Ciona intestinalis TaxID=7719 RepID=H2Y290_CIOIN